MSITFICCTKPIRKPVDTIETMFPIVYMIAKPVILPVLRSSVDCA
jgi:hypothetical protein